MGASTATSPHTLHRGASLGVDGWGRLDQIGSTPRRKIAGAEGASGPVIGREQGHVKAEQGRCIGVDERLKAYILQGRGNLGQTQEMNSSLGCE